MTSARDGFGRTSLLAYGAGFFLSVLFLLAAISAHPRVRANFDEILRANENHVEMRRLLSLIQDAELGQRGYLLTGDEAYLEPFRQAEAAIPALFDHLHANIRDAGQRARVDSVRATFDAKYAELNATILARRERGLPAALEIVATGEGRRLMDEIRGVFAEIDLAQRAIFVARAEQGSSFSLLRTFFMALAMLCTLVTGLLMIRAINRVSQERLELLSAAEKHVSDLRTANAALNRANEELQHFAYVASHDLQEPLRSMSGYVQLLGRRYETQLDEQGRGYIAKSLAAANRMQQLIEDLLTYTRVSTQGHSFESVDTAIVLQNTLANLEASIHAAGASVKIERMPQLWGDRVQLGQLFQNLLSNALKFRAEDPVEIHIGARRAPDPGATGSAGRVRPSWEFYVADNGIGIAAEYQARLFKIFQRLHTRQQYPGTGIGLAICKRIVERHGGRIWFESQEGKGTTFYFTLPVSPSEKE